MSVVYKVLLLIVSVIWLVGCDASNRLFSNKISPEMAKEFAIGDRMQAETEGKMERWFAAKDAVELKCPEEMLFDSQVCSQFLQQQFLPTVHTFVQLSANKFSVSMLDGRIATIDTLDDTRTICASNEDKRFLFLRQTESAGSMEAYEAWVLFDRLTGELTFVGGQPIFSTLGNYIVVHSIDIDAEFTPTLLDVYEVKDSGLSKVFNGINSEQVSWGPENVVWQDDQTILFDEVRHNPQSGGNNELHISVRKSVLHLNGRWFIK